MLKNYFKFAWRNLLKDRQFTILNLLGLSVGLTCALLIGLWVMDEKSVDKYNEKDARLYQVMTNQNSENGIKTGEYTPGLLANGLKAEFPEIEYSVGVMPARWFTSKGAITVGDKKLKVGGEYVDKDFFNVFTCGFVTGDKNQLFQDKKGIAITEKLEKELFGGEKDVIGKTVKIDNGEFSGDFVIRGVFTPNPYNATEPFDCLMNYTFVQEKRPSWADWSDMDPNTYVVVKEGTNIARLNEKIRNFIRTKDKNNTTTLFLAKYSDRYLYNNYENGVQAGGRIVYVRLFSLIAVFILLIACINFMNLSTARAAHRAKEVGIKKVVGASRASLIGQYLGESLLMTFLSLALAGVLVTAILPFFNRLTGKEISLHFSAPILLTLLGLVLLTGLFAGSYPAFYLSAFRPVAILKGKVRTSWSELLARKGLVVFQFTLSVLFIVAVFVVYRQVEYIQSRDLGYNRDHIIHFEIPFDMDSVKMNHAMSFVKELNNIPGVVNAGSYGHDLQGHHGSIGGFQWPGKKTGMDIEFANLEVGSHFLETVGIKISEGRNFSPDPQKAMQEIVFNQSAIKAMGLKDPIGKTVHFWDQTRTIVGVAADFNFESLYKAVKPCFFQSYPVGGNIMVRLKQGSEKQTVAAVEDVYTRFMPGMAFEYQYLNEDYEKWYASEIRTGVLSRCFAGLAIFISCLGLFGLAAFMAQKRQKEIGIRKVVGASVAQVAYLLSREFLILVSVAIAIAFPLAWLGMRRWLDGFAYRVDIRYDVFVLTALAAIGITIITIGYQAIKAATANPVDALRTE